MPKGTVISATLWVLWLRKDFMFLYCYFYREKKFELCLSVCVLDT